MQESSSITFLQNRDSFYVNLLSSVFNLDENSFCFGHWNCHVMTSNHEILQILDSKNCRFDVIGQCKTFLTLVHTLSLFSFPGYQLIVKNRKTKARRGLAFLVKEHLVANTREDYFIWIEDRVETFTLELEIEGNKILISKVCKPPSTQ